jgi:DNA (cytosine-5)-methyltransferase 1
MSIQTPLTAISLFSGAGGLDLGFHLTGKVQSVACYEYNEIFAQTLKYNLDKLTNPNSNFRPEIFAEDLSDEVLMSNLVEKWSGTDIVFGGPPCQSFSIMGKTVEGKKLGINDPRGSLIYSYLKVIDGVKPSAFLFENVPNIVNIDDGEVVKFLQSQFRNMGYSIWSGILCAADFGSYTFRKRFFIIGLRGEVEIEAPQPTHSELGQLDFFSNNLKRWKKCGVVFEELEDAIAQGREIYNHEKTTHNPKTIERFSKLEFGETDNVRKRNRINPDGAAHSIYVGGVIGKLQARPHIHPFEPRELTARECAMIQGFPIDWKIAGPQDAALLQAANAVPVQLAEALANHICGYL